ncbi:hypothetical protein [Chryseobacterium gwangjuense]|uniref:hypothetical protein n=1 Tax=Chryseobacterium gwangjuense TaxID=1069980 RepID=UPI001E49333A|nr:hypothetical protein [Chryseobacterium gwangjuense]MCE3074671.1 hypothetical protein [Chryseobacterium gwangjuense]
MSPEVLEVSDKFLNSVIGTSILHELLEGYLGALYFPLAKAAMGNTVATATNDAYLFSHGEAACIDPNYKDVDPKVYNVIHSRDKINGVISISSEFLILTNKLNGNIYYIGK